ncbi:MAG: ATPase [Rhodobacterales bacterium]|nr:ATPase [Rhodobacterales bacterium]NCO16792.1 ATPase [Alphaproteobacteria bacterium]
MSAWAPKRFWQNARVEPCDGGFTVRLDARPVRTPAKAALVVPSLTMASAIAAEWQAQQGTIKPETMPVTRSANAALDKIAPQFAEVAGLIAAYGASDLLCYRATGPAGLVARQAAAWDPMLAWAAEALAAPLAVTAGVTPITQPAASLARLTAKVHACTPVELAALHDLVMISGSLVLGLAVTHGHADARTIWQLSRIDEDWQIEQWGQDHEAGESAALRRAALIHAERFHHLCR